MKKLTDDTLLTAISNGISVVKFSAAWCGPCKTLEPVLEKVQEAAGVPVFEIDIDENPKSVELFGIRAVPTVMIFKDGTIAGNPQVGARAMAHYLDAIEQVKNSSN